MLPRLNSPQDDAVVAQLDAKLNALIDEVHKYLSDKGDHYSRSEAEAGLMYRLSDLYSKNHGQKSTKRLLKEIDKTIKLR